MVLTHFDALSEMIPIFLSLNWKEIQIPHLVLELLSMNALKGMNEMRQLT